MKSGTSISNSKIALDSVRTERTLSNLDYMQTKIDNLVSQAWEQIDTNLGIGFENANQKASEAYELSKKCGYVIGAVDALMLESVCCLFNGQYDAGLELLGTALQDTLISGYRYGEASVYTGFGSMYNAFGEHNRSLYYHTKALGIYEELGIEDMRSIWSIHGIGIAYFEKKQLDEALKYFYQAKILYENNNLIHGLARTINLIGNVYYERGDFNMALQYAQKSISLFEGTDNHIGLSRTLNDMGKIYQALHLYDEARSYFHQSLNIRNEAHYKQGQITTLADIGAYYTELSLFKEAEITLNKALQIAVEIKSQSKQAKIYHLLSDLFKLQKDYKRSLEYFERYHHLREKTLVEESAIQTKYLQMAHEVEKTARENEMYRLQNIELATLNNELEHALEMINDSLNYAQRIQNVILPNEHQLYNQFQDLFVFFKPREVVSGDFYWTSKIGDKVILAVVDCTGHGIPGAFMSMLGYSMLNQIVKERKICQPDEILRQLDTALVEALRQREDLSNVHDGMDVSITTFDLNTSLLQYAGANIPLYYFTNNTFYEIEPNRFPLGGSIRIYPSKTFELKEVQLKRNDSFYLFSDGFKDQFGLLNATKRKYSSKRFQDLLERIYSFPLTQQKEAIEQEFESWKGTIKQMDDVIVVGVRV